ncbi:MAG: hypothetical protein EB060_05840 [Proteobacteria bacterium]|nr:hypothetical protein [Pseudomonadota bacterium]
MKRYSGRIFAALVVIYALLNVPAAFACTTDAECNDKDKCTSDFCMFGLCQNVYNECDGYSPMAKKEPDDAPEAKDAIKPLAAEPLPVAPAPVAQANPPAKPVASEVPVGAPTSYQAAPVLSHVPAGLPKLPNMARQDSAAKEGDIAPSAGGTTADVPPPAPPVGPVVPTAPAPTVEGKPAAQPLAPVAAPAAPAPETSAPAAATGEPTASACANGKVLSLMGYRTELAKGSIIYVIDSGTCRDTPIRCSVYYVEDKKVKDTTLKELPKNYGVAVINMPKNQSFEGLPIVKELTAAEINFCGAQ